MRVGRFLCQRVAPLLACCLLWIPTGRAQDYEYTPSRGGFLSAFLVAGPFDASGARRSEDWRPWLLSNHVDVNELSPRLGAPLELTPSDWGERGRPFELTWELIQSTGPDIDFEWPRGRRNAALGYAELTFEEPFDGYLTLGADDDIAVWIDGLLLETPSLPGALVHDQHWAPLSLERGTHRLFFKTFDYRGRWAVSLRLVDDRGAPYHNVRVTLPGVDDNPDLALDGLSTRLFRTVSSNGQSQIAAELGFDGPVPPALDVLCARVESIERCLPIASWAQGPRLLRVENTELGDRADLQLTYFSRAGTTTRTITTQWPEHSALIRALVDARPLVGRYSETRPEWLGQGSLDSLEFEVARMTGLLEGGEPPSDWLDHQVDQLNRQVRELGAGRDPYRTQTGSFYRAYRSPIDGQLQHYAIYVPSGRDGQYDRSEALPLVVSLHGLRGPVMLNLRRVLGFDRNEARNESAREAERSFPENVGEHHAIYVVPHAFGDTTSRFMGESDVLRIIEEVRRDYVVDGDRVYLTGLSLGGIGSFALGLQSADHFAAVLSLCGAGNLRLYSEYEYNHNYDWELQLVDEYSAISYSPNALHLPVHSVHGTEDGTPLRFSSELIDDLRARGYVTSLDTPHLGHNVWARTYADQGVMSRLGGYERPGDYPRDVIVSAATFHFARQYWVEISAFEELHRFSRVDAHVSSRSSGSWLTIETSSVAGLVLHLAEAPASWCSEERPIEVDGSTILVSCGQDVTLSRASTGWVVDSSEPTTLGESVEHKGPGSEGPVQDAYYGPMLVVYGTQVEDDIPLLRRTAEYIAGLEGGIDVELPIVADREVTNEMRANYHLLLVGDFDSNALLSGWSQAPIVVRDGVVTAGEQTFSGDDLSVTYIYPAPPLPGTSAGDTPRYFVVYSGTSPVAIDGTRFGPRFLPDFLVYPQGMRESFIGRRTMEGRPVVIGGFFDELWQLPELPSPPPFGD
ncbi:MAG: prolyl oligopeptidase family serine peptidase [Myxococcales bacterium]|nr:prolyl oligopeptidase family serine peptidase [Myxococcales bacterium]